MGWEEFRRKIDGDFDMSSTMWVTERQAAPFGFPAKKLPFVDDRIWGETCRIWVDGRAEGERDPLDEIRRTLSSSKAISLVLNDPDGIRCLLFLG